MLKAHQAIIDLEKNVLRIQGREVKFLAEHELPDKARVNEIAQISDIPASASTSETPRSDSRGRRSGPSHFPGSGNTLGRNPRPQHSSQSRSSNRFPERDIQTLVNLGVSREVAISTLQAAGGNVDMAASLLF